jgi:predicted ATPase/DNA-binding CsgD family transcriptional regulator
VAVAFPIPQAQPTQLVGRTAELESIIQRLTGEHTRLITLIGPAGVGKTRLAIEILAQLTDQFADGAAFVDLAPAREARQVVPAIAQTLGLFDTGTRPVLVRLAEYLAERELLLVLDNFEQVLPAAVQLPELLAAAAGLKLLVTSRVHLRLRAEQTIHIFPLPVPDPDTVPPLPELLRIPAVALFVERAQAHRADFIPTEHYAPLLAHLARQLDGLPLAIELAAGQASALPLAAIARRLDRQLRSLQWDAHDLPERQRSLQAAIDWSYALLPPSERRLLRHLGVFVRHVCLDAIDAVAGAGDEEETLEGMMALVEKSLVLPGVAEGDDGELYFGMLETVRHYAAEKLQAQGERDAAGRAHAAYFLALAERADPELRRRDQLVWYLRLEAEHDNLRVALRWLLDHDEGALALRMAGALGYFWFRRGYHGEGSHWLGEALDRAPEANPEVRSQALTIAGWLLTLNGEFARSRVLLEQGLSLAWEGGDRAAIARSLSYLGLHGTYVGDTDVSQRALDEALTYARELQNDHLIGVALFFLSYLPWARGDYHRAIDLAAAALTRYEAAGNIVSTIMVRFALALELQQVGNVRDAVQYLESGLRTCRDFKDRWQLGLGLKATLLVVGEGVAAERRARLLGAADTLVQATGSLPGALDLVLGQGSAGFRAEVDRTGLGASYHEGRLLTFAEIVDLALELLEEFSRTVAGDGIRTQEAGQVSPLSAREHEVLRLVAEGLTNRRVGQRLFLSPRTIDHHLSAIFNKLGVDTRSQAVAVATQRRLL